MGDEEFLRRELNFELEKYLFENELGFELDHPLVRELSVRPDRVPYLNELYESKLADSMQALINRDLICYVELKRPHQSLPLWK
jgi:hypothetical protein